MFQCLSKNAFMDENENIKGWYVTLFDPTARWSGRINYKCSVSTYIVMFIVYAYITDSINKLR